MATVSVLHRATKNPALNDQSSILLLQAIQSDLSALVAQFNQLRTDFNAHTHGGVTAGAGTSAAPTATSATSVTLNTQP